jgi:hypothetical protein
LCVFLWAKGLHAKDINKEMLSVYGGKCLSCKAVQNMAEKFSQGRSKVADDARPGAEVAETRVERLLDGGFDALVKRCDKCIHVGEVYTEK